MQTGSQSKWRARLMGAALMTGAACASFPAWADSQGAGGQTPQSLASLPGKPTLLYGAFDLTEQGYLVEEFTASGRAMAYALRRPATSDGKLDAVVDGTADYASRYVVIRPSDPKRFNGTVLVEWLNVTAGQDTPADWMVAHREILRRGFAYMAVSAQKAGVDGSASVMGAGLPLTKANPARYSGLKHPGDAFAYDIFSQAGAAVKAKGASGLLGALVPKRVLAIGESQSAAYLVTYVNAVDPLARVYDGFFVHSRFGSGASLASNRGIDSKAAPDPQHDMPAQMQFRGDQRVPVLSLVTETDLHGSRLTGYAGSRRADTPSLRVWELAGAAHADGYLFGGAFADDGKRGAKGLAPFFRPTTNAPGSKLEKPYNSGEAHHYVVQAAIRAVDGWVRSGKAPASTATVKTVPDGEKWGFVTDGNGIAKGGIRTPWVDVPTMRLSGVGNKGGFIGMLVGVGEPFDAAKLAALYPGGKAQYLARFTKALDAAIVRGHLLSDDRQEILDIAAINYQGAPN